MPNLDICGATALWVSRNLIDAMLARDPCQFPQPPVTGAKVRSLRLKVEKAAEKAVAKSNGKGRVGFHVLDAGHDDSEDLFPDHDDDHDGYEEFEALYEDAAKGADPPMLA